MCQNFVQKVGAKGETCPRFEVHGAMLCIGCGSIPPHLAKFYFLISPNHWGRIPQSGC